MADQFRPMVLFPSHGVSSAGKKPGAVKSWGPKRKREGGVVDLKQPPGAMPLLKEGKCSKQAPSPREQNGRSC